MAFGMGPYAQDVGQEPRAEDHLHDRARRHHGSLVRDDQVVAEPGGHAEFRRRLMTWAA
ncbi:hypothetical protein AB0B40_12420 [Streptomyces sp. NPDC042638]|uniref:hypothetical protein n=1 Tax=Streptomyces sp. NPDC042638 TaxID=3154333 RepID=UPI0033DFFB20